MKVETLVILLATGGIMMIVAIVTMAFSVAVDRLTERFHNWSQRKVTNNK